MNNSSRIILDVRTPGEYASGHLPGAVNIDCSSKAFETEIGKLDKSLDYLVYCHMGNRSAWAVSVMKARGFRSLKNLDGGIAQWAAEKRPIVA